jgi:hypothetical protein
VILVVLILVLVTQFVEEVVIVMETTMLLEVLLVEHSVVENLLQLHAELIVLRIVLWEGLALVIAQ